MSILKNGLTFITLVTFSAFTTANSIQTWDWNDGTTQGWGPSDTVLQANNGYLEAVNNGNNGSLQIWGPSASDFNGASGISFKANLLSYSTASTPSDLVFEVSLKSYGPEGTMGMGAKSWAIDTNQLEFGVWKEFSFSLDDAIETSFQNYVYDPGNAMVDFFIRQSGFASNQSTIYIDDFVVSGNAVPVPAAAWLFGSALIGLGMCRKK